MSRHLSDFMMDYHKITTDDSIQNRLINYNKLNVDAYETEFNEYKHVKFPQLMYILKFGTCPNMFALNAIENTVLIHNYSVILCAGIYFC